VTCGNLEPSAACVIGVHRRDLACPDEDPSKARRQGRSSQLEGPFAPRRQGGSETFYDEDLAREFCRLLTVLSPEEA
jgi:hypothetical protein